MAACFNIKRFPASDVATLKKNFLDYQDQQCCEHGNGAYAGHLGIVDGLQVLDITFPTVEKAIDYISKTHDKWSPALAVKVGNFNKIFPYTNTEKKELEKLNVLQDKYNNWNDTLVKRAKSAKSSMRGCKNCGSKVSLKYLSSLECPVCSDKGFIETESDKKVFNNLVEKLKIQKSKVHELRVKHQKNNEDNLWVVGAWCSS